jgi:hypothetical protein
MIKKNIIIVAAVSLMLTSCGLYKKYEQAGCHAFKQTGAQIPAGRIIPIRLAGIFDLC